MIKDMKNINKTNVSNLLLPISSRKRDILLLLYRFRFLHSKQLQFLLSQKAHSRMRIWLTELKELGFIGSMYIPTTIQGRLPTIYYLEKNGLSCIRSIETNRSFTRMLWRDNIPRFSLLQHSLAAADLSIAIAKHCKETKIFYSLHTKAELSTITNHPFIQPDLFLKLTQKAYFLELDRETESEYKIGIKIKNYLRFYSGNSWHNFQKSLYPGIIFVSLSPHRQMILQELCEQILKQEGCPPVVIKFTTMNQIEKQGLREGICTVALKGTEHFLLL